MYNFGLNFSIDKTTVLEAVLKNKNSFEYCSILDNADYVDCYEYAIEVGRAEGYKDDSFFCWYFTMCFDSDGSFVGIYHSFQLNTPDGWQDAPVPEKYKPELVRSLDAFFAKLKAAIIDVAKEKVRNNQDYHCIDNCLCLPCEKVKEKLLAFA